MNEPFKDPDSNRKFQILLAQRANMNGFTKAERYVENDCCKWCYEHAGEVIPISMVISGKADHHDGHCHYRFLL